MSNPDELYECLVEAGAFDVEVKTCSVCGSAPALWQFTESGGTFSKAVMCSNGDAVADPEDIQDDGCPMYMPPRGFYKATRREAIKYWNLWHTAMTQQRQQRGAQ